MCGRFYVDDEMLNEIEKILKRIDRESFKTGDIRPTDKALIIKTGNEKELSCDAASWGYRFESGHSVVFNARSETVFEKPMFKKDFIERRCIIPARGFYEWDSEKNKYLITSGSKEIIYMAGIYRMTKEGSQFTILTEDAKGSLEKIHERMPVIIDYKDVNSWIKKGSWESSFLEKSDPFKENYKIEIRY